MAASNNRQERETVRTVRLLGEELPGGWQIAVWWYGHDTEGDTEDGGHLSTTVQVPRVDPELDQAWLVLVTAVQMLEQAGSVGRVSGSWGRQSAP